jgi:hypothetical protein
MNNTPILLTIVGLTLFFLIFTLVAAYKNKGKAQVYHYRTFFILGLIWLIIGLPTGNVSLWGIGIIFVIVGLVNKNKWKEEAKWADLSPQAKKMKIMLVSVLTVLLIVAIVMLKIS